MKKAIKLTAILCALVLLMGLAGCDDKAAQTPSSRLRWRERRLLRRIGQFTACGC